jgi:hypothetical protein
MYGKGGGRRSRHYGRRLALPWSTNAPIRSSVYEYEYVLVDETSKGLFLPTPTPTAVGKLRLRHHFEASVCKTANCANRMREAKRETKEHVPGKFFIFQVLFQTVIMDMWSENNTALLSSLIIIRQRFIALASSCMYERG